MSVFRKKARYCPSCSYELVEESMAPARWAEKAKLTAAFSKLPGSVKGALTAVSKLALGISIMSVTITAFCSAWWYLGVLTAWVLGSK
ncbi:hypothetical protein LCGC14_0547340 [marine sediment metagenome]|uniref:Uncharacterized protein n=1 Tax=marine sediment metagenome TaxID=412755 RepID=A0A0F9S9J5_9ZZZZ